jgi:hypothetical protein
LRWAVEGGILAVAMPDGPPSALRLFGMCLALALPPAMPAQACTVSTHAQEQLEAQSQLVVTAVAAIRTDVRNDLVWSGEITLDVKSIASNDTGLPVPQRVVATFAIQLWDEDCGKWLPDHDDSKYFLNVENGQFLIKGSR